MQETNPFLPPDSAVIQPKFGVISLFSPKGRIGRLRYFNYSILVVSISLIISLILWYPQARSLGIQNPEFLQYVLVFFLISVIFLLSIQRCHDFNATGMFSLFLLIPFTPLIFTFIPGTKGINQYGLKPPPNGAGVIIGSILLILPLIGLMGIFLSIALPAYQDYSKKLITITPTVLKKDR